MIDATGYLHIPPLALSPWGFFYSALFLALAFFLLGKRGPLLKIPALSSVTSVLKSSFQWTKIPLLLSILTIAFLLLDPLWLSHTHRPNIPLPREGKSWTLALDRSGSMWRTLPLPNGEIEPLVKYVAGLFKEQIGKRTDDLVAFVAFARKPDILLPLTPDRKQLDTLLDNLQKVPPDQDGTAITYSIYKTLLMIEGAKEREKTFHLDRNVLILATDGFEAIPEEDARDPLRGISLEAVLDKAKKLGVHIYVVSLFPEKDNMRWGPEIRRMQQIARVTDGGFFQATPEGLEGLFQKIDDLEGGPSQTAPPSTSIGFPLAPYLALVAFGLLFIYLLIREVLYLTLP